jgi:MFS family permease
VTPAPDHEHKGAQTPAPDDVSASAGASVRTDAPASARAALQPGSVHDGSSEDGASRGDGADHSTDRRQLVLICVTQFMAWAGFGAILPFLPVFLNEQAGAPVWMIGVIASSYYVGTFLFSTPLGRLSDVIGRKPVILTGAITYTVATFLFVTTKDPWYFVLFRLLEGIGAAAAGPAGNAFVADITAEEERSKAFGWLTTAQFGGLIAGPLLGSLIMFLAGGGTAGFYATFLVCSATMAVISVILALLLHEPEHVVRRRERHRDDAQPGFAPGSKWAVRVERWSQGGLVHRGMAGFFSQLVLYRRLATKPIVAFIVIAATGHFAMGAFEVLWSVWLRHLDATNLFIAISWAAFSVPMLLSFLGGRLADHGNRFWLMFSGYAISGCAWIFYGSTRNMIAFLAVNVLEGLAIAWSYPAKQAFLVQVSPRRWLGSVQGMEQTAMQLAALLGTLIAPLLYDGRWFFPEIKGYAMSVGGVLALCGLAYAAPILHREWGRIVASGEVLKAAEAERLAVAEPSMAPDDDLFIAR